MSSIEVDGEAIGRTRGGLTSKVHLAVDGRGLPMNVIITRGQAGDNPHVLPLIEGISVARVGPGRPRKRPDEVLADNAYAHPSTRRALRAKGVRFTCPEKADHRARRLAEGSRGGRPPAFDADRYAERNVVERCFNRFKQFRDLATRYAKRAAYWRSELIIASIILWLREHLQDRPADLVRSVRPGTGDISELAELLDRLDGPAGIRFSVGQFADGLPANQPHHDPVGLAKSPPS